jgi:hypothetical protein
VGADEPLSSQGAGSDPTFHRRGFRTVGIKTPLPESRFESGEPSKELRSSLPTLGDHGGQAFDTVALGWAAVGPEHFETAPSAWSKEAITPGDAEHSRASPRYGIGSDSWTFAWRSSCRARPRTEL